MCTISVNLRVTFCLNYWFIWRASAQYDSVHYATPETEYYFSIELCCPKSSLEGEI